MGFRYYVFDPPLIIAQIIALQALYYFALGLLVYAVSFVNGAPVSLALLFSAKAARSWWTYFSFTSASVVAGGLIGWLVSRAKQSMDFASTLQIIHFTFTCIYDGALPRYSSWWVLSVICVIIITTVGEYVSMNIDTVDITVSSLRSPKASDVPLV